jgi:glycerol-3-phosphate acyltransferase PlsY
VDLLLLLGAALGYLIGSFPTSYLTGRLLRGIDLRRHGSGNLGATNIYRTLGLGPAVAVAALDIAKGYVATRYAPDVVAGAVEGQPDLSALLPLVCGMAAVLGHVFPAWLGFRGGKGVATAIGVFLAVAPLATGLGIAIWVVVVALTRIVSIASLILGVALVPLVYAEHRGEPEGPLLTGFAALAAIFVFWTHRANLRRLLRGEERRLGRAPESPR